MKRLFNKIRSNKGNSLAEFAVTAAMMATLATTAAPRFSGVGDAGKANQTKQNLDKIGGMVNQFFMNSDDGSVQTEASYSRWAAYSGASGAGHPGPKWRSVFGTNVVDNNYLGGVTDENLGTQFAHDEFKAYLSKDEGAIKSPYRQGHYVFAVIPGGTKYYYDDVDGSLKTRQCNDCGPIMVIADAYNPSKYHTIKSFN